jgi:hypothetical protein
MAGGVPALRPTSMYLLSFELTRVSSAVNEIPRAFVSALRHLRSFFFFLILLPMQRRLSYFFSLRAVVA